ncbi:MAG: hypothetical protein R3E60_00150 [Alphaproteobacteria bacterium]
MVVFWSFRSNLLVGHPRTVLILAAQKVCAQRLSGATAPGFGDLSLTSGARFIAWHRLDLFHSRVTLPYAS